MRKKKKELKPVAFKDGIITKEDLPYPFVCYPGFYGSFFGFKKTEDSPISFCTCHRQAIENFIASRKDRKRNNSNQTRNFILDSMHFPLEIVEHFLHINAPDSKDIYNYLDFQENLCHECNNKIPKYAYCHDMYGSKFKVTYGWYINKQAYELGLNSFFGFPIPSQIPKEIRELLKYNPKELTNRFQELQSNGEYEKAREIEKKLSKQNREIEKHVENIVRVKFGHKKIGKAWTNETILYQLIKELFPKYEVIHHFRGDFLEQLELDIFIKEARIGVEYQGIQHFKPVEHWGGKEALRNTQTRDKRKMELCKKADVELVYFYYHEDLTQQVVKDRIQPLFRLKGRMTSDGH